MKETSRFRLSRTLGKLERPVKYGGVAVRALAVSDDGRWLVSRGPSHRNSYGYLWDLESNAEPRALGGLTPATISADGARVLGIEIDREGAAVVAWNVPALDEVWNQRAWTGNCTRSDPAIALSAQLIAYGYDQPPAVHVRRLPDGALCWRDDRPPRGRDLSGRGLAFSQAGDRLYAITQHYANGFKKVLTAYDSANGAVLWEYESGSDIARVLVTPDDATVVALFRTIQLVDAADGKLVAERPVPMEKQVIQAYAMSPQGELFLGGDGFAHLVDARSGEVLDRWTFTAKRFATCAAFTTDGTRLILGTNAAAILVYQRRSP